MALLLNSIKYSWKKEMTSILQLFHNTEGGYFPNSYTKLTKNPKKTPKRTLQKCNNIQTNILHEHSHKVP